jgi:hypothetical protein
MVGGRVTEPARRDPRQRGALPGLGHRVALLVLGAVKALTAGFAVYAFVNSESPYLKDKGMRMRGVGYLAGLTLVPSVWAAQGHARPYPAGADLAISTPLLVDASGNALGIYETSDRMDDVVHMANSASLTGVFGGVISAHTTTRAQATAAVVAFGICGGVAWELMEYIGAALGLRKLGISTKDTEADLAMDLIGTAIGAAVTWIRWQPPQDQPLVGLGGASRLADALSD